MQNGILDKYLYSFTGYQIPVPTSCNDSYICGEPTTHKDNTHINIHCLLFI